MISFPIQAVWLAEVRGWELFMFGPYLQGNTIFLTEVQLTYNIVLVSMVQHSDSIFLYITK